MSLRLKTQIVKIGLGFFHLFRYLWKSFAFVFVCLMYPLAWFVRTVICRALVPPYRFYRRLKQRVAAGLAASRNTWLYPFTTRYLIHVVAVLLTFGVAANSVLARETKVEEFGSRTLLSTFFQEDGGETEYVEYALPASRHELSSLTRDGAVDRYHRTDVGAEAERAILAIARQETSGEVLASALIPTTEAAGTPRSGVAEYAVLGGDTLGLIAERFGVSANTLRWANGLDERALIKPGQTLKIPPTSGVLHTIASGDTVEKIAKKYQVDQAAILEFNRLADASAIEVGAQLVIPGGKIEAPKPIVPRSAQTRFAVDDGPRPPNARAIGGGLFWPTTSRRINQGYSYRHTGIDIDGDRSPIYASAAGRVVRANWGRGYGLDIIIDHGNGLQTLYAHLSKEFVKVGDSVEKGQTIAISGCTGRCTGDHLHFEVWVSGRRTNPFNYF